MVDRTVSSNPTEYLAAMLRQCKQGVVSPGTSEHPELTMVGLVSSEGGPLIILDGAVAQKWRGIDDDGRDYQRACRTLREVAGTLGQAIDVGNAYGVIWDIGGPGTAHVFINKGLLSLVRAWLSEPFDSKLLFQLASSPMQSTLPFATIHIISGVIAILWATENGSCIENLETSKVQRPTGTMSMVEAGLTVPLQSGIYLCFADRIDIEGERAARLFLVIQQQIDHEQLILPGLTEQDLTFAQHGS